MNDFRYSSPQQGGLPPPPRHDGDNSSVASSSSEDSVLSNGDGIVTYAPKESFRLGYFDVCCLVINRMIGNSFLLPTSKLGC